MQNLSEVAEFCQTKKDPFGYGVFFSISMVYSLAIKPSMRFICSLEVGDNSKAKLLSSDICASPVYFDVFVLAS